MNMQMSPSPFQTAGLVAAAHRLLCQNTIFVCQICLDFVGALSKSIANQTFEPNVCDFNIKTKIAPNFCLNI